MMYSSAKRCCFKVNLVIFHHPPIQNKKATQTCDRNRNNWARTSDPLIKSQLLYHLSYVPTTCPKGCTNKHDTLNLHCVSFLGICHKMFNPSPFIFNSSHCDLTCCGPNQKGRERPSIILVLTFKS